MYGFPGGLSWENPTLGLVLDAGCALHKPGLHCRRSFVLYVGYSRTALVDEIPGAVLSDLPRVLATFTVG